MSQQDKNPDPPPQSPKGALTLVLILLGTLVVLWSWVYMSLLERGVTQ